MFRWGRGGGVKASFNSFRKVASTASISIFSCFPPSLHTQEKQFQTKAKCAQSGSLKHRRKLGDLPNASFHGRSAEALSDLDLSGHPNLPSALFCRVWGISGFPNALFCSVWEPQGPQMPCFAVFGEPQVSQMPCLAVFWAPPGPQMPCFAVFWAPLGSQMHCFAVFCGPQDPQVPCFGVFGGPRAPKSLVLQCFGDLRAPKCLALKLFWGPQGSQMPYFAVLRGVFGDVFCEGNKAGIKGLGGGAKGVLRAKEGKEGGLKSVQKGVLRRGVECLEGSLRGWVLNGGLLELTLQNRNLGGPPLEVAKAAKQGIS
eukprot:6079245-Amphidinium_carterae.1